MLNIQICPNCHTRVVPTNEGTCPACRTPSWPSISATGPTPVHADSPAIPLIVLVEIDSKSADDVDTEVYCLNTTERAWLVDVQSESFTTVDEEVGTVVEHGSPPMSRLVEADEAVKVAEVRGWEWDGYVGIEVTFRVPDSEERYHETYPFRRRNRTIDLPGIGPGRVVDLWKLP